MSEVGKPVNIISAISIPIWLRNDQITLGPATGFFIRRNGSTFLVSNWHVFSGRNANTGQPLSNTFLTPNAIDMWAHSSKIGEYVRNKSLSLYGHNDTPLWQQHPLGQKIDLACIKIHDFPDTLKAYTPDDIKGESIAISVGLDVMIVGFPKGLMHQGIMPIWKRGSIAAEPHVARDDGLDVYLVDSVTREGMSGSPVYLFSYGGAMMEDGSYAIIQGFTSRFLGVYSGRYGSETENEIQLGRVWSTAHLFEMLDDPKPGSYSIIKSK